MVIRRRAARPPVEQELRVGWFGKKKADFAAALSLLPDPGEAGRERILAFVRRHTPADPVEVGLTDGGEDLPDEEPSDSGIRWAAGAMDGVFGSHFGGGERADVVGSLVNAVCRMVEAPDERRASALYGVLSEHSPLSLLDDFLEKLTDEKVEAARVRALARWLIERSADREPVKFGIALVGVSGTPDDSELLMAIGRHEEFTLYSIVALARVAEDPAHAEASLRELGRRVSGWGRVHAVRFLAEIAEKYGLSEETRRWLLTDGSSNAIMDQYTAVIGARVGGLLEALRGMNGRDRELMEGAGVIISAILTDGGPAEAIDSYDDGPAVVGAYVDAAAAAPEPTLSEVATAQEIAAYLERPGADWTQGSLAMWTPEERGRVAERCRRLAASAAARAVVEHGLRADAPDAEFWRSGECAKRMGIDAWEVRFARLKAGKDEWFGLMQTADRSRAERVVEYARTKLPLASMTGKPTNVILPTGEGMKDHHAMDWIVSGLRPFPGLGWELVRTCLASPYTRHRNVAIGTLDEWGRAAWPADVEPAVAVAAAVEVDEKTRERMGRLLRGEPLDPPANVAGESEE